MEDHVEMDHFIKFGAFMLNRDQGMDLLGMFQIHTDVSNFLRASSKTV